MKTIADIPNGTASISQTKVQAPSLSSGSTTALTTGIPSYLFAEKLVPVLVDLFLQAPKIEKYIIFPELIQSLGRYLLLLSVMLNFVLHYNILEMVVVLG